MPTDRMPTVLIVEDQDLIRKLLERHLQALGYEPRLAEGGEQALQMLSGVDLVLTDALMPGMDGFALTRRIRQHPDHWDLPVIVVTSLNGKQDRLDAVEAGANDFITKPISAVELRIRCASLLKMKQAQDDVKHYQDFLEALVEGRHGDLPQILGRMGHAQQRARRLLEKLRQDAETRSASGLVMA